MNYIYIFEVVDELFENASNKNEHMDLAMENISKYRIYLCNVCSKLFYSNMTKIIIVCYSCSRLKAKFNFFAEEFKPASMPEFLLLCKPTFLEEQLIAAVSVTQFVYYRRGKNIGTKSHCISFPQDIANFAKKLPRLPNECQILILQKKQDNQIIINSNDLRVRRTVVEAWLKHLK
jgi:hypothetical protein